MTPEIKKGDVWWVWNAAHDTTYALAVLQIFGTYAVGVMLRENEPLENSYTLNCDGRTRYTDCARLTYAFKNKFDEYWCTLPQSEFDTLRAAVVRVLNLGDALNQEGGAAEQKELHEDEHGQETGPAEILVLSKERDLYEKLYYDLLNKLIGEKGGK